VERKESTVEDRRRKGGFATEPQQKPTEGAVKSVDRRKKNRLETQLPRNGDDDTRRKFSVDGELQSARNFG
jgi:hypothetical protein